MTRNERDIKIIGRVRFRSILKSIGMTRDHVLRHLRLAAEELDLTICEIEAVADYGDGEFRTAMVHLYGLLNIASNTRHKLAEDVADGSADDVSRWRQFPPDIDMILRL
jgi:hypothetical protein